MVTRSLMHRLNQNYVGNKTAVRFLEYEGVMNVYLPASRVMPLQNTFSLS